MDDPDSDSSDPSDIAGLEMAVNEENQRINQEHVDEQGILLKPDYNAGELAVLNPGVLQISSKKAHLAYRVEIQDEKRGKVSVIKYRTLRLDKKGRPLKLGKEIRTIIKPEFDYECCGCEDPRITSHNGLYYITYVAYDGKNARVALATTKDFRTIKKHGLIGPNIKLREASEIVGNALYKEVWNREIHELEKRNLDTDRLLWNKDAAIQVINGKWILLCRFDPHMHIAITDDLEQLKDQDFWREILKNIEGHTFKRREHDWEKIKIGWGTPLTFIDGRLIGIYHGVAREPDFVYRASFLEVDPSSLKPKSIIQTPLFQPNGSKQFHYIDSEGISKEVIFPTGIFVTENSLWSYYGVGDFCTGYNSRSKRWLLEELDHPINRLAA